MIRISGLKVIQDVGFKVASSFTSNDGRTLPVPANHKLVCKDVDGDIVNVQYITDKPLAVKIGDSLSDLKLMGFSRTSFAVTLKVQA